MKAKFNHLLPTIITSGGIFDTSKKISSIIFNYILERATIPLEATVVMKMRFYSNMVRTTLTMYYTLPQMGYTEERAMMK
jgi:hypothetical protein